MFQSTPPCGARLDSAPGTFSQTKFQSTRPVRGATLRHNVLRVVRLERLPLLWIVLRQVARPAPVALRRLTRQTKITDEGFAARALFLVLRETESLADAVKTFGVAEIESVELRADRMA